jgi:hypothetical protein
MEKINFRDSQIAFQDAIDAGKLTTNKTDPHYAGNYMYMHTFDGVDYFKNIETRKYDVMNDTKNAN